MRDLSTIRRHAMAGTGACIALLLAIALPARAVDAAGDASVAERLQAREIAYEVDADGDFKITIGWRQEGRSQLVFVAGGTRGSGALSVRQVFAPAARVAGTGLDAELATQLLRDNNRTAHGYWALVDTHLFFVIDLPEPVDAEGLETAINLAAEIADDKEMELTGGKDEF
jgi:hypothetical protein